MIHKKDQNIVFKTRVGIMGKIFQVYHSEYVRFWNILHVHLFTHKSDVHTNSLENALELLDLQNS